MEETMMNRLLETARSDRTGFLVAIKETPRIAYRHGKRNGAIEFARELLDYLGVDWREDGKEFVALDPE